MYDFVRVSCCVPPVSVANPEKNTKEIIKMLDAAQKGKVNFAVFPELALSGYTCADLFFHEPLIASVHHALKQIVQYTKDIDTIVLVGAPLRLCGALYNCAVVIARGRIFGIVPKSSLPAYDEFFESRWFSAAGDFEKDSVYSSELFEDGENTYEIPVGNHLIFETENGVKFAAELCEDLWLPLPPSTKATLCGAELIFNLSASNETVGKQSLRQDMIKVQSAKCTCAYAFVSAGEGESTTDLVFSGHSMIAQNGKIMAENEKFLDGNYSLTTDIDLGAVKADRIRYKHDKEAMRICKEMPHTKIKVSVNAGSDAALYPVRQSPFIPNDETKKEKRCINIFDMQKKALKKRLRVVGGKAVIGVSGGLDSTLALLVTCAAMQELNLPMTNILAVTMPCFGTTDRTLQNALSLMESLGVTTKNISIRTSCIQHFEDIGHDPNCHDITYENAQARERTQVLMDLANQFGGIVVGTGDLSELALGFCTYNGDQMSMYGVNAGLPKTLVRQVIKTVAAQNIFPEISSYLHDIVDTPISPELLPPDANGDIAQKTEDVVGPYELHDFFLYYILRYGYAPKKVYFLAQHAFCGEYPDAVILKWLNLFTKRFFAQQFKRNCMPDGVKIGSIGASPRGDLKMPSDAEGDSWFLKINE